MTSVIVYGAGAIGGITGAALARAGHDVLLVDSHAPHVDAINADGLTIERDGVASSVRVRAVTPDRVGRDLPLVLVAVKSHHTADALTIVAPRLHRDGVIVSLQNGLSEEQIAQAVGAERTVGCLVNWAADWVAPGRILHGGHGAFVLGELDGRLTPRVRELAALLSAVEDTPVTDNIWGYKWAKLIYGALLFATAMVDAHVYEVVERSPGVQAALVAIVGEGLAASDKAGVRLLAFDEFDPAWYRAALAGDAGGPDRAMAAIAAHYRAHTKTKTGIWRDLAVRRAQDRGRRPARRAGEERRGRRRADAAHPAAGRADPRPRGWAPPHGLGEPRPAGGAGRRPGLTPTDPKGDRR